MYMLNVLIKASSRYPIRRKKIKETVARVIEMMRVAGDIEVEIEVIGDRKMQQLKRDHLGVDETTDVLSFPLIEWEKEVGSSKKISKEEIVGPDGIVRIGNIFVSYPQAQKQANVHHLLIDDEIDQLVEHAMLHLLGVHHD